MKPIFKTTRLKDKAAFRLHETKIGVIMREKRVK